MRRTSTMAALVLAVAVVVSGCAADPSPAFWRVPDVAPTVDPHGTPAVGSCRLLTATALAADIDATPPVDCTAPHNSETVQVGTLSGAAATNAEPFRNIAARRAAFTACDETASEHLGADWRTGRVAVTWYFPTVAQWQAGARWFRCDVYEKTTLMQPRVVTRTSSLRDTLRGARPLALTCANDTGTTSAVIDEMYYLPCTTPLTTEFSGTFSLDPPTRPYPGDAEANRLALAGCKNVGARYLGVSANRIRSGAVWIYSGPANRDNWAIGDRVFRCFIGMGRHRPLRGTLRALGNRPLPR